MDQTEQKLVETKIYTVNETEFYELLPQEKSAIDEIKGTETSYDSYSGIVPIEVAKTADLAKPLMWDLRVLEVQITPDPFLVGILPSKVYFPTVPKGLKREFKDYKAFPVERGRELIAGGIAKTEDFSISSHDGVIRYYLLAQWGRELKELSELVKIAKQKIATKYPEGMQV